MAKCYICDKEIEDRFLFSHFSFGAHVGGKSLKLKCQWVDDHNKDILICQQCSAATLSTFAKSLMESMSEESHSIM